MKKGKRCITMHPIFYCFFLLLGLPAGWKPLERKTHHHLVLFNYFFSDRGNVVENASRARSHANVSTCPTHVLREHIMSLTAPFYYHRELYNSCSSNNSPLNFLLPSILIPLHIMHVSSYYNRLFLEKHAYIHEFILHTVIIIIVIIVKT